MGKLRYSLLMTISFGLISQTVQQFDDDHFPHPDTRTGPKRQVKKDDRFPDPEDLWPEIDDSQKGKVFPTPLPPRANKQIGDPDYFPTDLPPPINHQIGNDNFPYPRNDPNDEIEGYTNLPPYIIPQFDNDHLPEDLWPHTGDVKRNLPSRVRRQLETNNEVVPIYVPPIDHQGEDNVVPTHVPPIGHQINNFPGNDINNNHFPTQTPPRVNRLPDNDVHGDHLIPTYSPINGPKHQKNDLPDDFWPEIDGSQKGKNDPIDHQIEGDPSHPEPRIGSKGKKDEQFPSPDDIKPSNEVRDDQPLKNSYITPANDEKGNDIRENSIFGTRPPKIPRATCFGINGGNNCREKCQELKGENSERCYCSGSCEWTNLILTCKCKNPNCNC